MRTEQQLEEVSRAINGIHDLGGMCLALCKTINPDIDLNVALGVQGAEDVSRTGFGQLLLLLYREINHIAEGLDGLEDCLKLQH